MANVTPFSKILQEVQGDYKTMSETSELGKSGEIIIKHEISGHMNKYDLLENKIIYPAFFIKGSHEPIRVSEGVNKHMDTGGKLIQFTLNSRGHFTMSLEAS